MIQKIIRRTFCEDVFGQQSINLFPNASVSMSYATSDESLRHQSCDLFYFTDMQQCAILYCWCLVFSVIGLASSLYLPSMQKSRKNVISSLQSNHKGNEILSGIDNNQISIFSEQ